MPSGPSSLLSLYLTFLYHHVPSVVRSRPSQVRAFLTDTTCASSRTGRRVRGRRTQWRGSQMTEASTTRPSTNCKWGWKWKLGVKLSLVLTTKLHNVPTKLTPQCSKSRASTCTPLKSPRRPSPSPSRIAFVPTSPPLTTFVGLIALFAHITPLIDHLHPPSSSTRAGTPSWTSAPRTSKAP